MTEAVLDLLFDPFFLLVAIPAVLIVAISKGGFAGALVLIHVPLLSLVMSPLEAAALMLPLLIVMDAASVWTYRSSWNREHTPLLLTGAAVGLGIGAFTARWVSDDYVRILVGAVAVGFVIYQVLLAPRLATAAGPPAGRSLPAALGWGGMAGYTSFLANAGAPPLQAYLLPRKLGRTEHQATSVFFFAVVNAVKLVLFILLGQLSVRVGGAALALAPVALLGVWIGARLHTRASDAFYYRFMYALTFLLGLKLLWDGLRSAWPTIP